MSIAVSIFHYILDGCAAFDFMNNWAAMHTTGCMKTFPVERRSLLRSDGTLPTHTHPEFVVLSKDKPRGVPEETQIPDEAEAHVIRFTRESLDRLKVDAQSDTDRNEWISTNDALCGFLWKLVIDARETKPAESAISSMVMACNGRKRTNPPLPEGYFGNVNFLAYTERQAGEIQSMSLPSVARTIRQAVNAVTHDVIQSSVNFVHSIEDVSRITFNTAKPDDITFSAWNKFPMFDANFGSGIPLYVGAPPFAVNGFILLTCGPEFDGSILATVMLKRSQISNLLANEKLHLYAN